MKGKRYTTEDKIRILREADRGRLFTITLGRLSGDKDVAKSQRVMQALLKMEKLDIKL